MDNRLLLIDNDVFVLLSGAKKLDRVIELLRFPTSRVYRLPALSHMLQRSIERRSNQFAAYSIEAKQAALRDAQRIPAIPDLPIDPGILDDLAPAIAYDAPIYASLVGQPLLWLHSGDSQAMRRITSTPRFELIKRAVSGRVICLESILYLLVQYDDYEPTTKAFECVFQANKTVRCVLSGSGTIADPLESARSYLKSLCRTLGRGFLFCPPCPDYHASSVCTLDS